MAGSEVVFTDDAIDDLRRLGPSIVPQVLKKIVKLEADPALGAPLGGGLITYRKLVVGDRTWRVVYRVDGSAIPVICEIWAVGARSDDEVYTSALERVVRAASRRPALQPLVDVLEELKGITGEVQRSQLPAPAEVESVPDWLAERLVNTAGVSRVEVAAMTLEQAFDAWDRYRTSPPPP